MNDNLMFDYLLEMGAMRPEQEEMKRKQAMIDALRGNSMNAPQGQMIGKHYVPPSLTQYAAQLGQGFMAGQGQTAQDAAMRKMNVDQRAALEELRRRRGLPVPGSVSSYKQMDTADYTNDGYIGGGV